MNLIVNILWLIFIGWWSWLFWALFGLLWCITIIGIPVGQQCFKMASLSLLPFGREVVPSENSWSLIVNISWIIVGGLELAISYATAGLICCATIIGIPFGIQCFKLAMLSLLPFGSDIR